MPSNNHKLLILATVALVGALLYWAQAILIPIALAALLAFLLSPLADLLQHWGLRRIPAVILVVVLTVAALGAASWVLSRQAATLIEQLPRYTESLKRRVGELRPGRPLEEARGALEDVVGELEPKERPTKSADAVPVVIQGERRPLIERIPGLLDEIASAGLVVVLIIFLLIERHDLRDRFIRMVGYGRLTQATKALDEAGHRISRYLMSLALVNAGMGVGFGVGLYLIGLPYALLWGALLALARFIPFVGVWPAVLAPLALSLTVFDGWTQPVLVAALFAALEIIANVAVEPVLYSQRIGVSKVALLVAVAFWAWLWGPIGLVLGTPLTVCLVVLAKHVPALDFVGTLMGDEPPLEARLVFYQRVLARDVDEAEQIVEEALETASPDAVADELIMPALVTARRDRAGGRLDDDDVRVVVAGVRHIVENVLGRELPAPRTTTPVRVLAAPARDEIDAAALDVFRHLLNPARGELEILPAGLLTAELVARIGRERLPLFTLASLPPGGLAQTRYLVKRLHASHPDVTILVGRWGAADEEEAQRPGLTTAGAAHVGVTLAETRDQMLALLSVVGGRVSEAAPLATGWPRAG